MERPVHQVHQDLEDFPVHQVNLDEMAMKAYQARRALKVQLEDPVFLVGLARRGQQEKRVRRERPVCLAFLDLQV